jgi:DNA-binding SARP family transcriptional activator
MVAPEAGPTIEFRALGAPRLSSPEAELRSILARPKLLGLLSFLAFSPSGFHRRDTLLGLFWAEIDQARARRALRQSLYYLRQSLGPGVLVTRGEEEVGLDETRWWSDVRAFEEALEEGHKEEALELYRGDLLSGFYVAGAPEYERWLEARREELRRQASEAAWALARAAQAEGNAAGGGHWARRATALEPLDERLVADAIGLLARMGDRSGALRLYEGFRRRLEEELEVDPAPETQALVAAIRGRAEVSSENTVPELAEAKVEPVGRAVAGPLDPEVGPEEGDQLSTAPIRRSWTPGWRGALVGLFIGLAMGITLLRVLRPGDGSPGLSSERVVVAVFDNQTGDPHLDPLGRMAADWITQALHESGVVEVVPSTLGLAPRPDITNDEPSGGGALAEATGAGTIILGAYYRRGDSVEIQAQIVAVPDGRLLSALPPVGSPLDATGAAVDSLSRIAVRTLAVLSEPSLAMSADLSRPPSLEAYREYLEGLRAFQGSPPGMGGAAEHFYRAIELDSAFLAPLFYLVMAHANLGEFALAESNAQVLATKRAQLSDYQRHTLDWMLARQRGDHMGALEAARARGGIDVGVQALVVNRPAEAVEVLSAIDLTQTYFQWLALMEAYHLLGDFGRELEEARRGRAEYPTRLRMMDAELRALAALGRVTEADRVLEESFLLPTEESFTPANLMANLTAELRAHGHRAASSEVAERAIPWLLSRPGEDQGSWAHRYGLALAYYQGEHWEQARSVLEQLASETPEHMGVRGYLGALAARRGDRAEALGISEGLSGTAAPLAFGVDLYRQARIASLLGDRGRAVALLRDAWAAGWPYTIAAHRDMDLEPLRGYPPFEEFMRPKG